MSETIRFEVDGSPMDALVAVPPSPGPHPGIVLMYHQGGYSAFTRDVVARLALAGYAVIAPDNFHHSSEDEDLKTRKSKLRDAQVLNDIATSIDYLKSCSHVRGDDLAILGHCQGGRMAFLGASVHHVFRAAVIYYSGNMFITRGGEVPTPFERLKDIRCPVIGFFGGHDKSPTPEEVDKIEAELARHGLRHDFVRYPDAGHGFCDSNNPKNFDPAATADSWERMLVFLEQHLGSAANVPERRVAAASAASR
jgi:carboxymethylenebutenolidase